MPSLRERAEAPRAFTLAVAALALVAVVVRVLVMIGYQPVALSYPDEASYVGAASGPLFSNPFRPAGYSLFLRVTHTVWPNIEFTVAAQHLLGLAIACGLYLLCRRCGAGRWMSLVPAAVAALGGDLAYLEHILMSDLLFIALLILVCYSALRAFGADGPTPTRTTWSWLALSAVSLAVLPTIRTVALPLIPVYAIWVLTAPVPGIRVRLAAVGGVAVVCVAVLLGYAAAQQSATGVFGLTRFSGWPLYARAATFADCRNFTPPRGTAALCQSTPVASRPGPDFYLWDPRSPARRAFGFPPAHGAVLATYARDAILNEPLAYLLVVGRDMLRFADPRLFEGFDRNGDYISLSPHARVPRIESVNLRAVRRYWGPVTLKVNRRLVFDLARGWVLTRIYGPELAVLVLVTLAGIVLARGAPQRRPLALLFAFALTLLVIPVATTTYNGRYAIPAALLLVTTAARSGEILYGARNVASTALAAGRVRR